MRAWPQQALDFLDVAAAIPVAHLHLGGLARVLAQGGVEHCWQVALENLWAEHIEGAPQVLQRCDLAAPLLHGRGPLEAAGLGCLGYLAADDR